MGILLVADIGGTNGRFGLVDASLTGKGYTALRQKTLRCADYPNIGAMVKAYCKQIDVAMPKFACMSIAGPIQNHRVKMTNLNWEFSIASLREELNMQALDIINDFAALAYAAPHLQEHDIVTLYDAPKHPYSPIGIMGPGTGFGAAMLAPITNGWKLIPTEGGHCSFAPTTKTEMAILQHRLKSQDRVSIEHMLSGQGLLSIYKSLAAIAGEEILDLQPADVSKRGLSHEDPLCEEALQVFCGVLGSVAGDKALSWGATGGIFLGGGIVPKLAHLIPQTDFMKHFFDKGPMRGYVENIPVHMITNDKAALIGAAAWLVDTTPVLQT